MRLLTSLYGSQFGTAVQSSLIHSALPVHAVMQERRTLGETVGKYDGKHPRLTGHYKRRYG